MKILAHRIRWIPLFNRYSNSTNLKNLISLIDKIVHRVVLYLTGESLKLGSYRKEAVVYDLCGSCSNNKD